MIPPVSGIPEICLFSLLRFLPFGLLALYPFRDRLRFSHPVTLGLFLLAAVAQAILTLLSACSPVGAGLLSFLLTCLCIMTFWFCVRDRFPKLLFTALAMFTVSNLAVLLAKALERLLFPGLAVASYRWSLCLCLLIILLILTPGLFLYIRKWYVPAVDIQSASWHYLWTIPANFYLIWHCHLFSTDQESMLDVLHLPSILFLIAVSLGAFIAYHIVVLLLMEQGKAQQLGQQNHLLTMQKLQYDNLQHRINEARQARHDIRHHTHLIREYLRTEKFQELDAYLDNYTRSIPDSLSLVYCQHYAANALLGYFAQEAKSHGIEMDVFVQLPEHLQLPDTTLSVVLGNLLENAVEACREITSGPKKITVQGKADMGSVFFEITNPYQGTLRKNKAGKLLSGKSNNRGLGLDSVSHLVQLHGGMLELDTQNGIFRVSVLLPEQTGTT